MLLSFLKPRISRIFLCFCVIGFVSILGVTEGFAQRTYVLGTSVDFMGGVSNQGGQSGFNFERLEQGSVPFYGVYPSVSLASTGRRSEFRLDYSFIAEQFRMTPDLTSTSHAVTGSFNAQLSRTVRLRISDTFNTAPDYSTINVLKGFTITPEGFQYVFEPQLYKRSNISNTGNVGVDVDLTSRSSLNFAASGSIRHYDEEYSGSYFSDQIRVEGSVAFTRRQTRRVAWNIRYSVRQNDYDEYASTRTHTGTLGLSAELAPTVNLTLSAGPAYVEEDDYVGYDISANIAKRFERNTLTGSYSHRTSDSTGLGGASESHQGMLGFSRILGRYWSISFQASAFNQTQRDTDMYDYWGVRGSMSISRNLGEHWIISGGGSYMTYLGRSEDQYDSTYKRVYGSIGFRLPEFLRAQR